MWISFALFVCLSLDFILHFLSSLSLIMPLSLVSSDVIAHRIIPFLSSIEIINISTIDRHLKERSDEAMYAIALKQFPDNGLTSVQQLKKDGVTPSIIRWAYAQMAACPPRWMTHMDAVYCYAPKLSVLDSFQKTIRDPRPLATDGKTNHASYVYRRRAVVGAAMLRFGDLKTFRSFKFKRDRKNKQKGGDPWERQWREKHRRDRCSRVASRYCSSPMR